MNRINEMIRLQEYKNVKRVKLKDCCSAIFSGGTPLTSKEQFYDGNIPWIRSGEIDFNRIFRSERNISQEGLENSSAKLIRPKSVVMAMTGATVAKVATIEAEMAANQSVCALEPNCLLDYRFLYFYLATKYLQLRNSAQGALTSLNLERIKNIEIPLPPLNIQKEIVSILDSFTSLIDKMKQEVEMRKKQMEYYLNILICKDNVAARLFGDIGVVQRGKRVVRKELALQGCIPVFQNSLTPLGYYQYSNIPANNTFIISAGTAGEIGFSAKPFWAADDCLVISSVLCDSKYLYYYLKTQEQFLKSQIRGGAMKRLSRETIEKLEIPVPSLEKQRQIASILDSFETYISKLEKMIELRQKQYEYYREKLLTFE